MEKKIYRSKDNRMFSGLCGGLGEYFDIDPTIIRLLAVFAILSSCFTGLIAYFVCAMIIPQRPTDVSQPTYEAKEQNTFDVENLK